MLLTDSALHLLLLAFCVDARPTSAPGKCKNGVSIEKTSVLLSVSSKLHGTRALSNVAQATIASASPNSSGEMPASREKAEFLQTGTNRSHKDWSKPEHYAECNANSWSEPLYYSATYTDRMKLCLGRNPLPDDKILTQHGTEMTFGDLMKISEEGLIAVFPVQVQQAELETNEYSLDPTDLGWKSESDAMEAPGYSTSYKHMSTRGNALLWTMGATYCALTAAAFVSYRIFADKQKHEVVRHADKVQTEQPAPKQDGQHVL